jgi:ABC transporter substrate binding protein
VAVIAAIDGLPSILAAKAATTTIPVVFFTAADPIEFGLVASLNHPGGNVTGFVTLNAELAPKRFELLHEAIPTATVVALLVKPTNRCPPVFDCDVLALDIGGPFQALAKRVHKRDEWRQPMAPIRLVNRKTREDDPPAQPGKSWVRSPNRS